MNRRFWTVCLLSNVLILAFLNSHWSVGSAEPKTPAGKGVFGLDKVWAFHLELVPGEYEAMQPRSSGGLFAGLFGPPAKPKDAPPRETHKSVFNTEFPYVAGDFFVDGVKYDSVGLRYKGNSSYMTAARGLKRSIKIHLDHYDETMRFHGLKTLNLNCGLLDPTRLREALAYSVYREGGVPAPQTAFAEVTLTVPGKFDKELLGLYTVIEQVDKTFLKAHFKNSKGLLLKPERQQQLPYYGETWERYKATYLPKHEPTPAEARHLIEFTRLISRGTDAEFTADIAKYLDIDAFLRYLACTALVANLDSFFSLGHNYYLYLNPETNKFVFMPWDLDLSFGNFAMIATAEQQVELSLKHPYGGNNRLTDRLMAIPEISAKYDKVIKEVAARCFTREKLLRTLDTLEATTKDLIPREARAIGARKESLGSPPGGGFFGRPVDLRTFIEKRTASVTAQLDGTSTGKIPASGLFGAGQRPGGPATHAKPLLEALDTDRDGKLKLEELTAGIERFYTDSDKEKKGTLDEKELAGALNRILPQPPGVAAPQGGNVFGPGTRFAPALLKKADTNQDGKVSLAEMQAVAEAAFREADREKTGKLDEKAVATGITSVIPPPQFGRP